MIAKSFVFHSLIRVGLTCTTTLFYSTFSTVFYLWVLGREKFVPIQMKITSWFFFFIQLPLMIEVIVTMLLAHNYNAKGQHMLISVIVGAIAALINKEMIVPNVSDYHE